MSKRKKRQESGASWLQTSDSIGMSLEEAAAVGYDLQIDTVKHITISNIDIFSIWPDRAQPRRTMPSVIAWDGQPNTVQNALQRWLAALREERQTQENDAALWDWLKAVLQQETGDLEALYSDRPGPIETGLLNLVELAASIRSEGLTNAITIARTENGRYRLETGERRWMAYHLLDSVFGESETGDGSDGATWQKIPARVVEAFSVWRQAAENNARADLNAIGKARQYALLLMDLIGPDEFQPVDAFENEQAFYNQAADVRIPSGKSQLMLEMMGFHHRNAFSRCRAHLKLPNELWTAGDDYDLPEDTLLKLGRMKPAEWRKYLRENVPTRNILAGTKPKKTVDASPGTRRHFSTLTRTLRKIGRGKSKQNQAALSHLDELQQWIDEQRQMIQNMMDEGESS